MLKLYVGGILSCFQFDLNLLKGLYMINRIGCDNYVGFFVTAYVSHLIPK
jgi:hypothetical protein